MPNQRASLQTVISRYPFERIGIDITGPFPITARGNKYSEVKHIVSQIRRLILLQEIWLMNLFVDLVHHSVYTQIKVEFSNPRFSRFVRS